MWFCVWIVLLKKKTLFERQLFNGTRNPRRIEWLISCLIQLRRFRFNKRLHIQPASICYEMSIFKHLVHWESIWSQPSFPIVNAKRKIKQIYCAYRFGRCALHLNNCHFYVVRNIYFHSSGRVKNINKNQNEVLFNIKLDAINHKIRSNELSELRKMVQFNANLRNKIGHKRKSSKLNIFQPFIMWMTSEVCFCMEIICK